MSENLKETKNALDPFGIRYKGDSGVDLSNPYVNTWELELDTTTGETKAVNGEPLDFVAQIQTFKEQCGIEAMKRDIAAGRATPGDFADDGQHGGDFTRSTMVSEYVGQLVQAELKAEKAKNLAERKGLDTSEILKDGADIEAYINKVVSERLAATTQKGDDSK